MVDLKDNQATLSLGVVGGGRGGLQMLELFGSSRLATVRFLADPDPGAPAVALAKSRRIAVYGDGEEALRRESVDFLVDTTGIAAVGDRLARLLEGGRTVLLDHRAAGLLVRLAGEHRQRVRDEVGALTGPVQARLGDGLQGSRAIVGRIDQVMSSMQMLTLNASIEASKAGVHGRGFAVVADQMGKSVETVRRLTQEIEEVNQHIGAASAQIEGMLGRLH